MSGRAASLDAAQAESVSLKLFLQGCDRSASNRLSPGVGQVGGLFSAAGAEVVVGAGSPAAALGGRHPVLPTSAPKRHRDPIKA